MYFSFSGNLDYSARIMRVVTWDRSFRETQNIDEVKDDFDSEKHETLGTVLDKLLAWEKKLYNQVKVSSEKHLLYFFFNFLFNFAAAIR